jgi:hypothetical protein
VPAEGRMERQIRDLRARLEDMVKRKLDMLKKRFQQKMPRQRG